MVIENPDDKWREVAVRLIADTALLDSRFERDFFGDLGPGKKVGAYVLEAGRLVTTRLQRLTERIDQLHGNHIDPATRERLKTARCQLSATIDALTGLPEAIDPDYRR